MIWKDSYGIDLDLCKIILSLFFADDIVMFAETKIELQRLLNKLYAYYTEWNLKVNKDKTKVIVFRNGGYLRRPVWKMVLWWYSVERCYRLQIFRLGYFFKIAIVFVSKNFGRAGVKSDFGLKANLNKFGTLSANLLLKMFGTKLFSILTYGTEIWFSHEALGIEKINHNFCNFCKYTFKLPPPPPVF